MSNPDSIIPTKPKREPPTPTKEQLKKMATTPCNKGDNCKYHKRGNCRYLHGGSAVAFDAQSHKKVSPPTPPPPTEADILAKVEKLGKFGGIADFLFKSVGDDDKLEMLRTLLTSYKRFEILLDIVKDPSKKAVDIIKHFDHVMEHLQKFFNENVKIVESCKKMREVLSADELILHRVKNIERFREYFALPEGIEEILRAFDSQTVSYAHALSLNPLEKARMNPDEKPHDNLIQFLQTIPHFSEFDMFKQMISTHNAVGKKISKLTNKALVALYDAFMALHENEGCAKEQRATELAKQEHKRTVQQIVGEIHCLKATNLAVSFNIMTANRDVFREFVNQLDESNQAILVAHFSTFMSVYSAWMSMSMSKDGSISVVSLNAAFGKFLSSFKLDKESRDMDDMFFEFYRTPEFSGIFDLLNVMCPSPDKDSDSEIASSNVLKRFLKAINEIFGSSVNASEKPEFESKLASRGLVLLSLVMMSPKKFSKWVSAPFSRSYKEMQSMDFKSFLYKLTQKVTHEQKFDQTTFKWESLPNYFMIRNRDGDQEFSTEYLFQVIDEVLSDFMSASNTGLSRVDINEFLQERSLDWLFTFEENERGTYFMYVNEHRIPHEVKRVLLRCYIVDDSSDGARQVSHLKSLLSISKDQIRMLMKLMIGMPSSEQKVEDFEELYRMLGLDMSPNNKESACSGLNKFLGMLQELSPDSDLYSEALAMMSVFSYMQKHGRQSRYFMSLPASIIFVLMMKKFPTLTHSEIANLMYKEMYGHCDKVGTFVVNQKKIEDMLKELDERSSMKDRLQLFTCTARKDKAATKECETLIAEFKMLFEKNCSLLHEFLKRALSYFMNLTYLAKLFQDWDEQLEVSTSSQTPEKALNDRLKTSFNRFLMQAISQKKRQIFFDLSKTFEEIERTYSVQKNLAFYKFARHVSAWINLVNSLFENMGIQHRLSFDEIMTDFPDTKSKTLTPLEKATLMTRHVCGVLSIPVPENTDDFVQHDQNSVLFWVVYQSLLATYKTELPKKETEVLKEVIVRTISIPELKTQMEKSTTLDEFFSIGLPYMDSRLIRDFMIHILMHHFSSGNKGKLNFLLRLLRRFESKFTPEEKSYSKGLFAYIEAPLPAPDISNLTSYVCTEEECLSRIIHSLHEDRDWTDADVSVVISDEIAKRVMPRVKFVKAPLKAQAPIDSGMASGGCAAVAVESESEEEEEPVEVSIEQEPVEASVKPPFDATHLREFLVANDRSSAIAYLESVKLNDTLVATIDMLKNEDNSCVNVINALIQYGIFEED